MNSDSKGQRYYISGQKTKNSKYKYLESKVHLGSAIRKAKRYYKRGWYHVCICDSLSCNQIFTLVKDS